jgi:hypothetical protein
VRRVGCIRQLIAAVRRVGAVHSMSLLLILSEKWRSEVDVAVDLLELRSSREATLRAFVRRIETREYQTL